MSITSWITSQRTHFLALTKTERRLLLSFFLFALAAPMTSTYVNTFLWRQEANPLILILYNLVFYAAILVGFIINGFLLRYSCTPTLYLVGSVVQGVVPLSVVMLGERAPDFVVAFSLVSGVAAGFFWANRNYLTSKLTESTRRFYFITLENALSTLAGIAAPITIGWFLIFGDRAHLYSVNTAYYIAAFVGLVILVIAGRAVTTAPLPPCSEPVASLLLRHPPKLWNRVRLMEFLNGLVDGVESVVPVIIVLSFLGSEETVGTIDSASAVIAAILIYAIGKRVRPKHYLAMLSLWVLGSLIGGGGFTLLFSATGVLIYFVIAALIGPLRWTSLATIMYEMVDASTAHGKDHRFVFIMDREFFLALGRMLTLSSLFLLYQTFPVETARYSLLLIVPLQALLVLAALPLARHMSKGMPILPAMDKQEETLFVS